MAAPRIIIGHPHQYRWMYGVVVAVLALNLVDAVLTMIWLATGAATEANPIMAALIALDPVVFVAGKMTLVSSGCLLLWHYRARGLAVVGVFTAFIAYYLIVLHHMRAVGGVLAERV